MALTHCRRCRVFKVTECTITNFCNKTQRCALTLLPRWRLQSSCGSPRCVHRRRCRFDGLTLLRNATGGMDIILEVAGKDATKDFDDVGHSNDAKPLLRKMLIGKIA